MNNKKPQKLKLKLNNVNIRKKIFKNILQGHFENELSQLLKTNFDLTIDSTIKRSQVKPITDKLIIELKSLLNFPNLSKLVISFASIVRDETQLGVIPIVNLFDENLIYFRKHTKNNDLLFNIYSALDSSPIEVFEDKLSHERQSIINSIRSDAKHKEYDHLIKYLDGNLFQTTDKDELLLLLKFLEIKFNCHIIILTNALFVDSSESIDKNNILITDNTIKDSEKGLEKTIIPIYAIKRGKELIFEPVIVFNINDKNSNVSVNEDITPSLSYSLKALIDTSKSGQKTPQANKDNTTSIRTKILSTNEVVEFNPFDKGKMLPKINLRYGPNEKIFLIGHEINGYNVLYSTEGENDIVGKVILDKPKPGQCSLFLCE